MISYISLVSVVIPSMPGLQGALSFKFCLHHLLPRPIHFFESVIQCCLWAYLWEPYTWGNYACRHIAVVRSDPFTVSVCFHRYLHISMHNNKLGSYLYIKTFVHVFVNIQSLIHVPVLHHASHKYFYIRIDRSHIYKCKYEQVSFLYVR